MSRVSARGTVPVPSWFHHSAVLGLLAMGWPYNSKGTKMFSNRRSRVTLLGAATTVALVMTGCAPGTGESGGVTEVVLMSITEHTGIYTPLVESFNETHDDIQIRVDYAPQESYPQVLATRLQGNNAVDVFYGSSGTGDPKSLIPLGDAVLDLSDQPLAENVPPFAAPLYTADGKLYGWPLSIGGRIVAYSEKYTEAGLDVPETFDELIDQCGVAADLGKNLFGLGALGSSSGLLIQQIAATEVYGPNPEWDADRAAGATSFATDEGWQRTMAEFQEMIDAECFPPDAGASDNLSIYQKFTGSNIFAVGFVIDALYKVDAAIIAGGGRADSLQTYVFPPSDKGERVMALSSGDALAVNANSGNPEAALEVINWFAEVKQANAFAAATDTISNFASPDDPDSLPPVLLPVAEYIADPDKNRLVASAAWPAGVYQALLTYTQGLFTGQSTTQTVLEEMDKAWDANS